MRQVVAAAAAASLACPPTYYYEAAADLWDSDSALTFRVPKRSMCWTVSSDPGRYWLPMSASRHLAGPSMAADSTTAGTGS